MISRLEEIKEAIDHSDIKTIKTILSSGEIDPNIEFDGRNLLTYSFKDSIFKPNVFSTLLECGLNINTILGDNYPHTFLNFVLLQDRQNIALLLLESGADPNIVSHHLSHQIPPLWYAARDKDLLLLKTMLEKGANPNIPITNTVSNVRIYPLFRLADEGCLEGVKLLLEYGANPLATSREYDNKSSKGKELNAYEIAKINEHTQICEVLQKAMQEAQAKKLALQNTLLNVKDLSSALFNALEHEDYQRCYALIAVLQNLQRQEKIMTELKIQVPYNVKEIIEKKNAICHTLLMEAAVFKAKKSIVHALLELGANPEATNSKNNTSATLIISLYDKKDSQYFKDRIEEYQACLDELIAHGAKVNPKKSNLKLLPPSLKNDGLFKPNKKQKISIPDAFYCPISMEVMKNPTHCTLDGVTYEYEKIYEYLSVKKETPSRVPLGNEDIAKVLSPNRAIIKMIDDFKKNHPELFDEQGMEILSSFNFKPI